MSILQVLCGRELKWNSKANGSESLFENTVTDDKPKRLTGLNQKVCSLTQMYDTHFCANNKATGAQEKPNLFIFISWNRVSLIIALDFFSKEDEL